MIACEVRTFRPSWTSSPLHHAHARADQLLASLASKLQFSGYAHVTMSLRPATLDQAWFSFVVVVSAFLLMGANGAAAQPSWYTPPSDFEPEPSSATVHSRGGAWAPGAGREEHGEVSENRV